MAARKRKDGESFKEYRNSLREEALRVKRLADGEVIWPSWRMGTYVRKQHGEIGYRA